MTTVNKVKNATTTLIGIGLILAIIIVANILARNYFTRLDLTEDKEYTISDVTIKMLNNLDDIISINVYFTEDLPPYLLPTKQRVDDMLNEFKAYSKNIQIKYIDPKDDKELQEKLMRLGIPQIQMNIIEKDKQEVMLGFLGIDISFGDKHAAIPVVNDVSTLEYELSAAIKRVSSEESKTIGFFSGKGSYPREQAFRFISQELQKQYTVTDVSEKDLLLKQTKIDTLVLASPSQPFTEREIFELDQHLMDGNNLVFLLDGVKLNNQLQPEDPRHGLEQILTHYGITIEKNLILDDISNAMGAFSSGFVTFYQPYPLWPVALHSGFNVENPIVSRLEALFFPWVSSITYDSSKQGSAIYTELVKTSNASWSEALPIELDPQRNYNPDSSLRKPHVVSLLVTGKITSAFKDKSIPSLDSIADEQTKSQVSAMDQSRLIKSSTSQGKIWIVADSDFLLDSHVQRQKENLILAQNAIDWLTLDPDLIKIRSRGSGDKPLKKITDDEKKVIKYKNTLGVPVLVILLGLGKFALKKRRRKAFLQKLEQGSD